MHTRQFSKFEWHRLLPFPCLVFQCDALANIESLMPNLLWFQARTRSPEDESWAHRGPGRTLGGRGEGTAARSAFGCTACRAEARVERCMHCDQVSMQGTNSSVFLRNSIKTTIENPWNTKLFSENGCP